MKKYVIEPGKNAINAVDIPELVVGPNEVKVKVKATSLNYRDILNLQFSDKEIVPFSDGAGEVVEVGSDVTDFTVGDRVVGLFFPTWIEGSINQGINDIARGGGNTDGMLAEVVVGDEKSFMSFPDHLTYEEASTLPCAGLTAWHALFEHGQPAKEGQTVLILGTGGVSIFALQLAVAHGLKTIVLSSSDEKLERVKKMGATHTINYRTIPDWDAEVLKLTGNKGVDMVLEVGGAGTLEKSMNAVKVNGTISLIGVLSGLGGQVNPLPIVLKSLRIFGIYVGSKAMQSHFHHALSEYSITPVIDRVFEFDEAADSYEYQKSGKHFGKVVVSVKR
jgi:NADPH:quinone reductase-like Zn-dependent oxidoreductase